MVGNANCDTECYTKDCKYDAGDCGCAPECRSADYGTCKPACLVPACGYDAMPGFPACSASIQRESSRIEQILTGSFSTQYEYNNLCVTTQCSLSLWQSSFSGCVPACNVPACIGSFGHCETGCEQGCELCLSQRCVKCTTGLKLFFTKCVLGCPTTFSPSPLDSSLCYYDGSEAPAKYYVTATGGISQSLGTAISPFHSLGEALAAVHTNLTHIKVLQGLHSLSVTVPSPFLQQWDDNLLSSPIPAYDITIEGVLCTEESHILCSDTAPVLVINNVNLVQFRVHGHIFIRNIRITGRSPLVNGCIGDFCVLCPKGTYTGANLVDEWGNSLIAGAFTPQIVCDRYHSRAFIQITEGSTLSLTNVTFADFLQEFDSLISLTAGTLNLTSVSFTNITTFTAVIVQISAKINGFEEGFLVLNYVSVSYINSAFRYESALQFGGFMQITGIQSIYITDCNMMFNLLSIEKPLIWTKNFLNIIVNRCLFADNLGIILLASHNVTLPTSFASRTVLNSFLKANVNISDSEWSRNTGSSCVMINFFATIPDVRIARNRLNGNHARDQAVLTIAAAGNWKDYESDGQYLQVTVGNTLLSVFSPQRRVILENMTMHNNSGMMVLNVANLSNCRIVDLVIRNSGSRYTSSFAESNLASLSLLESVCTGTVALSNVLRMKIIRGTFKSNECTAGPAAILGTNLAGNFSIIDSIFVENKGIYGVQGSIMDLSSSTSVFLINVSLARNVHSDLVGKGLYRFTPLSSNSVLIVTRSSFAFNTASEGGTLNCLGNVLISDTAFTSNTCTSQSPAGLVYSPSLFGAFLLISKALFASNSGHVGSAISLTDPVSTRVPIQLSITDSSFESNVCTESGSCLLIDSSVGLTQNSRISNSVFQRNSAANACIWISYFIGILSIENCIFRLNSATSASVIYGQHPRSLTSMKCLISLNSTLVEENTGFTTMYFDNTDKFVEGRSQNLTLRSNIGRGIYTMHTYWQDRGSQCINNSSPSSGACIIVLFYGVVSLVDSKLIDNKGKLTGGTITVGMLSNVLIENCTFVNNFAVRGGAIFSEQGSTLNIRNSRFHRNRSTMEGAAIYLLIGALTTTNSTIYKSNFTENVSVTTDSAVIIISSQVIFDSCYFNGNSAISAPGIGIFLSTVSVLQSTFTNQTSQQGVFISVSASSSVLVSGCSFAQGTATAKGGAIYISSSLMWVSSSRFADLTASNGAAIAAYSESTVVLSNSVLLRQNATSLYGGVIYSNESPLRDIRNRYEDCWNGIIVGELVNIYIDGSVYSSNCYIDAYSLSGAGLFCRDCPSIIIKNALFTGLAAVNGACIHLPSTSVFGLLDISLTTVQNSHADETGALLLENGDLRINECIFVNNSAGTGEILGNGGAVSLFCPSRTAGCSAVITNSTFRSNVASHEGGAIRWTDWKPTLINLTFEDNRAAYGPNIASFAIAIANASRTSLKNVASGQVVADSLGAALLDHYGQVMATDSATLADLLPGASANVTITGTIRVQAVQGMFVFSGFTITAKPNSTTSINIYTSGVDLSKAKTADPEDHYQSYLPISVTLRPCVPGEALMKDTCYLCPEGKYSLSPDISCAPCPDGAICYGNSTMTPKSGYWRETNLTDKFVSCPNEESCLGSIPGDILSATGICAEGYFGNLCTGCLRHYYQSNRNYCEACPDKVINIVQTTAISIGFVLGVCGIIKFSLISAQKQKSSLSVFLKIFVNYLQLVAATSSFNMDWPGYAMALFNAHENLANVGTRAFSFDCLLDSGGEDNQAQAFYAKIVMITIMPLGIISVAVLFWGSLALICQKKAYIKQHVINSIVVAFFVAHPSIVSFSFDVFNCRELNAGEYWLNSALNIRCWDKLHTRYSLSVALPCLVVWGTFAPLLALLALISRRNSLISQEMRIRLGFLYNGYELRKYYWEFVILYRKIFVIAIVAFLTNVSSSIQALAVLLVLAVALVIQARNMPYVISTLNELEQRAILVSAVTLYCGLFFVSDALNTYTKILLFVAIVLTNVYFLGLWMYRICITGCTILLMKIPFLKRFTSAYKAANDRVLPLAENQAEVSFSMDRSLKGANAPANSVMDGSVDRSSSLMRHSASIDISAG